MVLTFAEEILLLALDDETGRFVRMGTQGLGYPLAGAVLMDLALRGKIDTDLEKLVIIDSSPTGEPLLDGPLARIAAETEQLSAREWIGRLLPEAEVVEEAVLSRLVERGILRREEKRILWVFKERRYPMIDDTEEKEVKRRLVDLLLSDEIPSPRDVALIALVDACDLLGAVLSAREVERVGPRVEQIRKLDLIGQAMTAAVQNLRLEIARSIAGAPGISY